MTSFTSVLSLLQLSNVFKGTHMCEFSMGPVHLRALPIKGRLRESLEDRRTDAAQSQQAGSHTGFMYD